MSCFSLRVIVLLLLLTVVHSIKATRNVFLMRGLQASNSTNEEQVNSISQTLSDVALALDTLWVFVTGITIVGMQVGFAILEAGTVQVKNVRSILMKNMMDAIFGAICWYLIGYGIYQGSNAVIAGDKTQFAVSDPASFGHFVQQYGFAITAVTIVSGSVCSRIKFGRYAVYSVAAMTFFYPVAAHVAWTEGGYLYEKGFKDFAGSGVVHGLGGISALVAAKMLGPRVGRFDDNGSLRTIREHNAVLIVFGGLILFISWFAFNAGSSAGLSDRQSLQNAANAMITTLLSSCAAGFTVTMYRIWFGPVQDLATTINGMLSGLVAITGPCAFVSPWASVVIGLISGLIYLGTSWLVLHVFKIDDPINAFAVHGSCGIFGVIITGVFDMNQGLIYGYGTDLLKVQTEGAAMITAWALVTTSSVFFIMLKAFGLRVSDHDQLVGLDILYHSNNAYDGIDQLDIRRHNFIKAVMKSKRNSDRRSKRHGSEGGFKFDMSEHGSQGRFSFSSEKSGGSWGRPGSWNVGRKGSEDNSYQA